MASVIYHMKEKLLFYKNNCEVWPWTSCLTEHIHWTMARSKIKNCKNRTKTQQSMRKRFQWRDMLVKRIRVVVKVSVTCHPSLLFHRIRGPFLVPRSSHEPPPHRSFGKCRPIPGSLHRSCVVIGNHSLCKNMHYWAFSGNLETNTAGTIIYPLPQEKGEHTCYRLVT